MSTLSGILRETKLEGKVMVRSFSYWLERLMWSKMKLCFLRCQTTLNSEHVKGVKSFIMT